MNNYFSGIYKDKRVLVTGHTGFKGSWLCLWLKKLGAEVYGIALEPNTEPSHWNLLNLSMESHICDIRNLSEIKRIFQLIQPDIIFHLAAQPIVRVSYENPVETYTTNVLGTVNVLEASRYIPNLKAVIIVTSDKCYDNKEWVWGYRENETMGGKDPYSSSKGCAELVTAAYRDSFFSSINNSTLIASVRAGNVIGGGDWAQDRILTDIVISASQKRTLLLRNPKSTRPWQFVLEPLSGYLCLGEKLLNGIQEFATAWNFGPGLENNITVEELVLKAKRYWDNINYEIDKKEHPYESNYLMLDSTKAYKNLFWKPVWDIERTIKWTIDWYKAFYNSGAITSEQILANYLSDAKTKGMVWCK
jgi:CDP-glucose 4,6-dehydratase